MVFIPLLLWSTRVEQVWTAMHHSVNADNGFDTGKVTKKKGWDAGTATRAWLVGAASFRT
jgi:hypothetical protein